MKYLWLLVCLLLNCVLTTKVSKDNVVMLVEMARHGARSSYSALYKADWIQKYAGGELTDVGKRQRYYLGKNTKTRYPDLFKDGLKANQYYVRSTAYNRTLESGISHLLGIMDGTDVDLQFENDDQRLKPPQSLLFDITHIDFKTPLPEGRITSPVHSDRPVDLFMRLSSHSCPPAAALRLNLVNQLEKDLKTTDNFSSLVKQALKRYGAKEDWHGKQSNPERCWSIADFALMDLVNNPNPKINPKTSEEDKLLVNKLSACYSLGIAYTFINEDNRKIAVSPVLQQILEWFNSKINKSKEVFPMKYALFSGHDSTISPHLVTYGLLDMECMANGLIKGKNGLDCGTFPSVASNLVWELIEDKEGDKSVHSVKVSYNGEYIDYCQNKKKEAEYKCSWSDFQKITKEKYTMSNYLEYCGLPTDTKPPKGMTVLVLSIAVGSVFITCIALFISLLSTKKQIRELESKSKGEDYNTYMNDSVNA